LEWWAKVGKRREWEKGIGKREQGTGNIYLCDMRVVIQRVSKASVLISSKERKDISSGLLVLLGIEEADNDEDVEWLCGKILRLRIFGDAEGVMNLSVLETGGDIMLISQFTLHASTKKGNRPSYIRAAKPETSIPLYERFIAELSRGLGKSVVTGEFGAHMEIELVNDGPVTIVMDSRNRE
jgi:D-tyrosyl-tRNA(Tyr) deacylase